MEEKEVDVVVSGGGPVGLTLAAELRLAGLEVALLERRAEPVLQSRALTMHGRTLEMLGLRGLAPRFMARSLRIPTGHFAGLPTRLDFTACDTSYPFTLFIAQSETEALLTEWALELGVDLRRRALVEQIQQPAESAGPREGVRISGTRDGSQFELRARYLVGCDGARSLVRQQVGIQFPGLPATKTMLLGDVLLAAPPKGPVLMQSSAEGGVMIVPLAPLGQHRYRIVLIDKQRMGTPQSEPVTLDELRESTRRVAGDDFGMCEPSWLSRFTDETRLATHYRQGRVFLAGDAAHTHLPAGGQGMNVGMQDAMNLGWKLAGVVNGLAPESLLDSYHRERHPVGAALYRNTLAQAALMTHFDPSMLALREVMSELMKLPALNAMLANDLSAFGIGYPAPLVSLPGELAPNSAWTGRRVPDWPLRMADGSTSSLHSLLHDGRWLLLRLGAGASEAAETYRPALDARWYRVARAEPVSVVAELAGVHALLVRPDGHADHAV